MAKEEKQPQQLTDFDFDDFETFQKEALKQLKVGKSIAGKDRSNPLIKRIVESALKGELDAHLESETEEGNLRVCYDYSASQD